MLGIKGRRTLPYLASSQTHLGDVESDPGDIFDQSVIPYCIHSTVLIIRSLLCSVNLTDLLVVSRITTWCLQEL